MFVISWASTQLLHSTFFFYIIHEGETSSLFCGIYKMCMQGPFPDVQQQDSAPSQKFMLYSVNTDDMGTVPSQPPWWLFAWMYTDQATIDLVSSIGSSQIFSLYSLDDVPQELSPHFLRENRLLREYDFPINNKWPAGCPMPMFLQLFRLHWERGSRQKDNGKFFFHVGPEPNQRKQETQPS